MAIKKYTCPKCGTELEYDEEALKAMGHSVVCPECQSVLKADGDFLYIPTEDLKFEPVDPDADTPPPFTADHIVDTADHGKADSEPSDPLYEAALEYIASCNAISLPMLMNYFHISEEEAAALMAKLEANGVVAPFTGGPRKILIPHNESLTNNMGRTYETDQMQKTLMERMRQAQANGEMPKVRSCSCSLPGLLLFLLIAFLLYQLMK